jgi:hypothetical protein
MFMIAGGGFLYRTASRIRFTLNANSLQTASLARGWFMVMAQNDISKRKEIFGRMNASSQSIEDTP